MTSPIALNTRRKGACPGCGSPRDGRFVAFPEQWTARTSAVAICGTCRKLHLAVVEKAAASTQSAAA